MKKKFSEISIQNSAFMRKLISLRSLKATSGFTLVEMIVAIAIFMFVMVVAVGSLVAIIGADRRAQATEAVVDNLRFALDDMSRTVRTGTEYNCGTGGSAAGTSDCLTGGSQIAVIDQYSHPQKIVYRFSTALQCGAGFTSGCLMRSTDGGTAYLPITSPEVAIDPSISKFYARGSTLSDGIQPVLTMLLSASVDVGNGLKTSLHLQTTVTQRTYDN